MLAGAPPQTPLEELTAPPDPLAGFKGAASRQGGAKGRMGRGQRDGEGGRREGREREGMEEGRGKVTEGMGGTGQDTG